jgi:hypothetical protein
VFSHPEAVLGNLGLFVPIERLTSSNGAGKDGEDRDDGGCCSHNVSPVVVTDAGVESADGAFEVARPVRQGSAYFGWNAFSASAKDLNDRTPPLIGGVGRKSVLRW